MPYCAVSPVSDMKAPTRTFSSGGGGAAGPPSGAAGPRQPCAKRSAASASSRSAFVAPLVIRLWFGGVSLLAEVGFLDAWVGGEILRGAFHHDAAGLQHVGSVGVFERG